MILYTSLFHHQMVATHTQPQEQKTQQKQEILLNKVNTHTREITSISADMQLHTTNIFPSALYFLSYTASAYTQQITTIWII